MGSSDEKEEGHVSRTSTVEDIKSLEDVLPTP